METTDLVKETSPSIEAFAMHQATSADSIASRPTNLARRVWSKLTYFILETETFRLLLAYSFLLFSGIFMAFMQQFSDTRWAKSRPANDTPLEDVFVHLPDLMTEQTVTDILLMSLLVITIVGMIILSPNNLARIILFRRIGWVVGCLYLYRACTVSVTTLPATSLNCAPVVSTGKSFGEMLVISFKMIIGTVKACTDLIYSGHTMVFTTCAVQWRVYCRYRFISYYVYVHAGVGIVLVVLTRLHYTVDVLLGLFLTLGFWSVYFGLVRMVMERLKWAQSRDEALGMSQWEKEDPEYQRVAFTPRMMNSGLVKIVAWLDAIDLRWERQPEEVRRAAVVSGDTVVSAGNETATVV